MVSCTIMSSMLRWPLLKHCHSRKQSLLPTKHIGDRGIQEGVAARTDVWSTRGGSPVGGGYSFAYRCILFRCFIDMLPISHDLNARDRGQQRQHCTRTFQKAPHLSPLSTVERAYLVSTNRKLLYRERLLCVVVWKFCGRAVLRHNP